MSSFGKKIKKKKIQPKLTMFSAKNIMIIDGSFKNMLNQ